MTVKLMEHFEEIAALILFGIGFTNLLLNRNMMKKIIGFSMMDSAIYLFLTSSGFVAGHVPPIVTDPSVSPSVEVYSNPVPTGLVLTGIVVSVSVTAFSLALTQRLYKKYHSLDIDEILMLAKRGDD